MKNVLTSFTALISFRKLTIEVSCKFSIWSFNVIFVEVNILSNVLIFIE